MFFGLIVLLAVVAAVYFFTARRRGTGFEGELSDDDESPWEIVGKQYARGEIDREELERRRSLLRGETGESEEGGAR